MSYATPALGYPRLQDLTHGFQRVEAAAPGVAESDEALARWHLPDGTVRRLLDVLSFIPSPTHSEHLHRDVRRSGAVGGPDFRNV